MNHGCLSMKSDSSNRPAIFANGLEASRFPPGTIGRLLQEEFWAAEHDLARAVDELCVLVGLMGSDEVWTTSVIQSALTPRRRGSILERRKYETRRGAEQEGTECSGPD